MTAAEPGPAHDMRDAQDARNVLEALANDDPRQRVIMLDVLSEAPTGSPEVLHRVRELMADVAPAVLSVPYVYGEVRHMAARALAAEHHAGGVTDPVLLIDVPSPLKSDELATLRDRAGLRALEPLAAYAELVRRDLAPLTTINLDPAQWTPGPKAAASIAQGPKAAADGAAEPDAAAALDGLAGADPQTRAATLRHLSRNPTGSPEVAAAVRALLADRTPVNVSTYSVGELRWAAAHALAAENRARGAAEPVALVDVPAPLSDVELGLRGKEAGVGDGLTPLATYAALRERDLVPVTTLVLADADTPPGGSGVPVAELVGRALDFADRARASMCAEFGVRTIGEVAMRARLKEVARRGTCADGLRYDIHGNGYDVYAGETAPLTLQSEGYAKVNRRPDEEPNTYDYVDLYALSDFLRDWAATTTDTDTLAVACAEYCRRGVLRKTGDKKYELLRVPGGLEESQ